MSVAQEGGVLWTNLIWDRREKAMMALARSSQGSPKTFQVERPGFLLPLRREAHWSAWRPA
jgi:hypothetical protein